MANVKSTAYPPSKLTKRFIDAIKPPGKRIVIRDTTVPGLVLRVSPDATNKTFYFDYRTKSGKRAWRKIDSADHINPAQAKAKARKLAVDVLDGRDPAGEHIQERRDGIAAKARTLSAYLEGDYLTRHLSLQRTGEATKARIKAAWKPFLNTDMAKLSKARLADHRAKRIKAGVSWPTLNRDRTALIALLNKAVEDELLSENPVPKFKCLKLDDHKRVRYLVAGERKRFMKALEQQPEYFAVMVKLALLTGMRRGELLQLAWPNVGLLERQVTVHAATAKGKRTRVIPLPPAGVRLLKAWKKQQTITDIRRHVFLNEKEAKPFKGVKRRWAALIEDAGVTDFRFHDLRHDYASRLVQSKVSLYEVQTLLGHASIEETERYAHLAPGGLAKAVRVLS